MTSVYTRMAYGQGDVEPVRAPQPMPHVGKDCDETARFKRENERQEALALRTAPQTAPVNVVELQVVEKGPVQPSARTQEARPFVPFLAQQIAQEGLSDSGPDAATRRKHEAAADAYVLASNDGSNILGPVRSRELVI